MTQMSRFEEELASYDLSFQRALAAARALRQHPPTMGTRFEDGVCAVIKELIPATHGVRPALLASEDPAYEKQLDLVVHPAQVPLSHGLLPIDWITVAGEIKSNLSKDGDIRETVWKLSEAAFRSPRRSPLPFFVIAGQTEAKGHEKWLSRLVASVSRDDLSWTVWPAAFSFGGKGPGDNGEGKKDPLSALSVSESSPIRAEAADGNLLNGVITVHEKQLSPSALCYLWLWASIYAVDPTSRKTIEFMRDQLKKLCLKEGGLAVRYWPDGDGDEWRPEVVTLLLPDDKPAGTIPLPVPEPASPDADSIMALLPAEDAEPPEHGRKVMLITLGAWVDEPDTWDESPWGGSRTETRRGYGYYEGMPAAELLNSCRLFWAINPDSGNWDGIKYAVIAYQGLTRAVVRIDVTIGPFWGRYGFRGRVVTDTRLVDELVGREVPRRRSPVTTLVL
jgi:hypothetical protein